MMQDDVSTHIEYIKSRENFHFRHNFNDVDIMVFLEIPLLVIMCDGSILYMCFYFYFIFIFYLLYSFDSAHQQNYLVNHHVGM